MELLVMVIEKNDDLDKILEKFQEIGIQGVTILDSMGTGHLLTEDISIFGRLMQFAEGNKKYNKTVFTIIKDERTMNKVVSTVEEVVGDIDHPHTALVFTIPLGMVKGLTNVDKYC
ncbi:P-II family nitrogen regulator [Selenihalanaerobacter shriftii]|uniref:Nitrogen regulatory protein P-II n=1 Tax=Selenihalanaerobacter shriftii TaxID=142842 RepID=A0A1T4LV11_9FIRM|nr:P-II family nitrogen regulator [Selenihalanaerobacter shriftii]SJZ58579.1 Nitrogen regulatory protein P-II [Selenihalanaerobacter shriftii]